MMPNSSTMPIWIRPGLGFESDFEECKKEYCATTKGKLGFRYRIEESERHPDELG